MALTFCGERTKANKSSLYYRRWLSIQRWTTYRFTSKDNALVKTFRACLDLKTKVSAKKSGTGTVSYHTQFGDVLFYRFLQKIGLLAAKSKTLGSIKVPRHYFRDFLRGYFDGDGTTFSYNDSLFPNSYRFYLSFISASPVFLSWLQSEIARSCGTRGYINFCRNPAYQQLKFAKTDAKNLVAFIYYAPDLPCLKRKRLKIQRSMRIISARRGGETGKHAAFRAQ